MTITHNNGIILSFQDGFDTKAEALADYVRRLGSIADIVDTKEGIELNYKDGRKITVTL